jgi:uncharacterized GH25 family protein
LFCVAAAVALRGATVAAHDLWIEPTAFLPEGGKVVGIRLRVGEHLMGDPVPRDPALVRDFVVADATGTHPIAGRDGSDPAGLLRIAAPGLHIVGYQSAPSRIALAADKFNQYLSEEGLEHITELRARRKQSNAGTQDSFIRCAKSLILSGAAAEHQRDRALGFTLELVAERNPYLLNAGDELPVQLTYERRPLAGALVVALNRRSPGAKIAARSDKDGRVRFRLPHGGMWLIKVVHMVPAPSAPTTEWASYWASLTFALKEPLSGPAR